jgi:hypothetical protein
MSEAVLLAGKRGSGKSLGAVDLARKYLMRGCPVATNLNLYLDKLVPAWCKTEAYRLPDYPTASDLAELPLGNPGLEWRGERGESDPVMISGFREENNGLLLLDEVATFLNSREWNHNGRQEVISWFVQSRKYGWDLCFIAQHANMLDKQIRESLIDVQGTVKRMDRIAIPFLSPIWKYFTGSPLCFPKIHYVVLFYGFAQGAPVADRWFFRGAELYAAYDTLQRISPLTGQVALSTMLSAYELKGCRMKKWDLRRQMAAGGLVIGCLIGFMGGFGASWYRFKDRHEVEVQSAVVAPPVAAGEEVRVKGIVGGEVTRLVLTDGRTVISDGFRLDGSRMLYRSGERWYARVE